MKKMRVGTIAVVLTLITALFISAGYTQIVRPIEVKADIRSGCSAFNQIKALNHPKWAEAYPVVKEMGKLARLDPRYLDVAKAAIGYYYLTSTTDPLPEEEAQLQQNFLLLYGFCQR